MTKSILQSLISLIVVSSFLASMFSCHETSTNDKTKNGKDTIIVKNNEQEFNPQNVDSAGLLKYLGIKAPNNNQMDEIKTTLAGQTIFVNTPFRSFRNLTLGDNSSIIIDPLLDFCEIVILNANLGDNFTISCQGANGSAGENGIAYNSTASSGKGGDKGFSGKDGSNGRKGTNLKITVGFETYKKVVIFSKGGDGGKGGEGGNGQKGAPARCDIGASPGGIGGLGGNGGFGGSNGNIEFRWYLNGAPSGSPTGDISIGNLTSKGGGKGNGGPGGAGGDGIHCGPLHRGSGDGGSGGPSGQDGSDGAIAAIRVISQIPKPIH